MTTSLKRLKNLVQFFRIKTKKKPSPRPNKKLKNLKILTSPKKLEKKKKELVKKARVIRRQYSNIRNKCNFTKKKMSKIATNKGESFI